MTQSITRRRVARRAWPPPVAGLPQTSWAAGPVGKLRILETTDLRGHLR